MSDCCRICLEDDDVKNLIIPCICKGTQKYIHPSCLYRWQDTMLNNHLSFPERFSSDQILRCRQCNTKYKYHSSDPRWKFLYSASPLLTLMRRYTIMLSLAFGCFLWAASFLFFPFFLNLLMISIICFSFVWYKGIRPRFFMTEDGIRIGFIRIGVPVPNLRSGVILKASSIISEGIFYQSRILITKYDINEGAVGFIINKNRSKLYLDEFYIGGPVQPESVHILHDNPEVEGCERICEGIYLGGRMNPRPENTRTMTLYGYSGWSSLQLDGEVRAGVWEIEGNVRIQDFFAN